MVILLLIVLPGTLASQTTDPDIYYRFPLSMGVEYLSLSPFGEYGTYFNPYEIAGVIRWPLPDIATVQPQVRVGATFFNSTMQADPSDWSHQHLSGAMGATYAKRLSAQLELGAELLAGYSRALFPELVPELGTVHVPFGFTEVAARIGLNPSFNLSVQLRPTLRYQHAFGPLDDFNGLLMGFGLAADFRFGQDPDRAQAMLRSIRLSAERFPTVFAAMQSYYANNPITTVTLTNTERHAIHDIEVSFFQDGYMHSPTPCASVDTLPAGETVEVDILASYSRSVFNTEGITPLTGDIIVGYTSRGRPGEQRIPVSYDLYDKTAITWDDDRRVAAFITPDDSAIRNYGTWVRQACRDVSLEQLNGPLQTALQVYTGLTELDVLYQPDPVRPFTTVQGNPMVIDSVRLPRETLVSPNGECDDLTVLYCTILEALGVETGFITVPGHIYPVINTGEAARAFGSLHPERFMTIDVAGELWIPIEITLVGRAGFVQAWESGATQWEQYESSPSLRRLYATRDAHETFRPVGLEQVDLGVQYGSAEAVARATRKETDRLVDVLIGPVTRELEASTTPRALNRIGVALAKYGRHVEAKSVFERALRADPTHLPARVNLASILLLSGNPQAAVRTYQEVYDQLVARGEAVGRTAAQVLLNMARAQNMLEQFDGERESLRLARAADPDLAAAHRDDTAAVQEEGRATQRETPRVMFLEDDL